MPKVIKNKRRDGAMNIIYAAEKLFFRESLFSWALLSRASSIQLLLLRYLKRAMI
jgi:hypothetical protein